MGISILINDMREKEYKEVWFNQEDLERKVFPYLRREYGLNNFNPATHSNNFSDGHVGTLYGVEIYFSEKIPKDYIGIKFRKELN